MREQISVEALAKNKPRLAVHPMTPGKKRIAEVGS
jgi:hypothetical protein